MCGIAGFFGGHQPTPDFIDRALRALASRGPDGSGVWQSEDGTVALVHTRLAILDLTEASSQPMVFDGPVGLDGQAGGYAANGVGHEGDAKAEEAGSFHLSQVTPHRSDPNHQLSTLNLQFSSVLVFNGEIYNYRELRRELEAQGETFSSDGDTEVLLRLLVREGAACLPKLAGMFAFAFWNQSTGEALLARDPLGIKPLYYRKDGGSLYFASEVRVLRREGDPVDPDALRDYFLWGSVPDPQTLLVPVRQLPAGHFLQWKNGEFSTACWYQAYRGEGRIDTAHFRVLWQGLSAPAVVTRVALEESMLRHLVSDVPVGIFLSGGIDSTVLLALARKALGPSADIRTFSIGFDDPEFDESTIARRTAEHFGALHTEWMMTGEEGAAEIPAFLNAMDQPGIDGFNTWCVSKLARREGMKVVLSGLGGDEIFAGYGTFTDVPRFHRLYRWLGPLRGQMAAMLATKPAGSPLRRLGDCLSGDGAWLHAYHAKRGIFTAQEAHALVDKLTGCPPGVLDWQLPDLPDGPREVVAQFELTRYMRHQLLRDSDVYSMAHGLELRVPLVDSRLIESISAIPPEIRLQQGKKLLLAAVPEVPEWVKNQPKRGFRFPFQQWMEGQFGELLSKANEVSPVELNAWYRTWAVAAAVQHIPNDSLIP